MRSYPVKENQIGSAVSEILRYKQTDKQTGRQTDIVLLCIKDKQAYKKVVKQSLYMFTRCYRTHAHTQLNSCIQLLEC